MPDTGSWRHSRQFEDFVLSAMRATQVPGVSVAVVQNGSMIYAGGFGIRSLDGVPVTSQTPFMIGSATKPLTTLMIARLIDRNKLSWSTPMVGLLDDFALEDLNLTRQIQLQHAASHSTGMPRRDWEFIFCALGSHR